MKLHLVATDSCSCTDLTRATVGQSPQTEYSYLTSNKFSQAAPPVQKRPPRGFISLCPNNPWSEAVLHISDCSFSGAVRSRRKSSPQKCKISTNANTRTLRRCLPAAFSPCKSKTIFRILKCAFWYAVPGTAAGSVLPPFHPVSL